MLLYFYHPSVEATEFLWISPVHLQFTVRLRQRATLLLAINGYRIRATARLYTRFRVQNDVAVRIRTCGKSPMCIRTSAESLVNILIRYARSLTWTNLVRRRRDEPRLEPFLGSWGDGVCDGRSVIGVQEGLHALGANSHSMRDGMCRILVGTCWHK